jgi:hypothetical protein
MMIAAAPRPSRPFVLAALRALRLDRLLTAGKILHRSNDGGLPSQAEQRLVSELATTEFRPSGGAVATRDQVVSLLATTTSPTSPTTSHSLTMGWPIATSVIEGACRYLVIL